MVSQGQRLHRGRHVVTSGWQHHSDGDLACFSCPEGFPCRCDGANGQGCTGHIHGQIPYPLRGMVYYDMSCDVCGSGADTNIKDTPLPA